MGEFDQMLKADLDARRRQVQQQEDVAAAQESYRLQKKEEAPSLTKALLGNPVVSAVKAGAQSVAEPLRKVMMPTAGGFVSPVAAASWQEGGAAPAGGKEGVEGAAEIPQPNPFAGAGKKWADAQRESADLAASIPVPGGGGYRPEELKMGPEFQQAADVALGALQKEREAGARYGQAVQPLEATRLKQVEAGAKAEEGRMGRLEELGREQKALSEGMGQKIAEFKVDPERLFAQGPNRAVQTFGLGLANIASNIGEAMQGKQATNAVLALVQQRVAQDIALQENDYQRMLQGYNVKRNGLMDAIQQVGSEREGAQALAKQQALVYADQLGVLARKVGLTDAQAARPLLEAEAKIKMAMAEKGFEVEKYNVAQRNEAAKAAAAQAAAAARASYSARVAGAQVGLTEHDQKRVQELMDEGRKKGIDIRLQDLSRLRDFLAKPGGREAAMEAQGVLGKALAGISSQDDRGAIGAMIDAAATKAFQSQLSPQAKEFARLYSLYSGPRIRSMAGANVTGGERYMYDPLRFTSPEMVDTLINSETKRAVEEAQGLKKSAAFVNPAAEMFLDAQLEKLISGVPNPIETRAREATEKGTPVK